MKQARDLAREERRHDIPDLNILLCPIPEEQVIVGKGLKASSLANSEATALSRIRMDEIMSILRYVACYGRSRLAGELDSEAVVEDPAMPVAVVRAEFERKIRCLGAITALVSEHCREHVTP